jgi:hypothetical protein
MFTAIPIADDIQTHVLRSVDTLQPYEEVNEAHLALKHSNLGSTRA